MKSKWTSASFEIASHSGPRAVVGFVYRGLGLDERTMPLTTQWSLSHLGTGHRIARLNGGEDKVFAISTEIAEAGDWDFLSMSGWKDRFPDAPVVLDTIARKHLGFVTIVRGAVSSHQIASQISSNRP